MILKMYAYTKTILNSFKFVLLLQYQKSIFLLPLVIVIMS